MPRGRRAPRPLSAPRPCPLVKGIFVRLADWPQGTQRPPQVGGGGRRLCGGGRDGGRRRGGHRPQWGGLRARGPAEGACDGGREQDALPARHKEVAVASLRPVATGPDLPQLLGGSFLRPAGRGNRGGRSPPADPVISLLSSPIGRHCFFNHGAQRPPPPLPALRSSLRVCRSPSHTFLDTHPVSALCPCPSAQRALLPFPG